MVLSAPLRLTILDTYEIILLDKIIKKYMKTKHIKNRYKVSEEELQELFKALCREAEAMGVNIHLTDLSHVKEVEVFAEDLLVEAKDDHNETAVSDGKNIFLHVRTEEQGGVMGQIYDLLHIAFGHMLQWASDMSGGLQFFGNFAYEVGTPFFLGASDRQLEIVRLYEREAGVLALNCLRKILSKENLENQDALLRLFSDYAGTDLWYIIDYYREGLERSFFDNWRFGSGQELLKEKIKKPSKLDFIAREVKAVPLINK
jgi:hypothetical protein